MKVWRKFSSSIFLVGVLVLAFSSFIYYRKLKENTVAAAFNFLESHAFEVAWDLNQILSEKNKSCLILAGTPLLKNAVIESNREYQAMSETDREQKISALDKRWRQTADASDPFIKNYLENSASVFLRDQQRSLPGEFGEIFLTDKFGVLAASTGKLTTLSHAYKPWWKGCYNNSRGTVYMDDRGFDESVGACVLGIVVPVRDNGEIIGILKCNFAITGSIKESVMGSAHTDILNWKLVRSGGMVILDKRLKPLCARLSEPLLSHIGDSDHGSGIVDDPAGRALYAYSVIPMTQNQEGVVFGGNVESIDHKMGNRGEVWFILGLRDMREVLDPVAESTRWMFLLGLIMVFLMAVMAFYLGRLISGPINKLSNGVRRVGEGNFDTRIMIESSDEIGDLARSFNSMADKLNHTTASLFDLEREMEERRRVETALRQSEETYRFLFEESPVGLCMISSDGRVIAFNDALLLAGGYTADDLADWAAIDQVFFNKDDFHRIFDKAEPQYGVDHQEVRLVRKDGGLYDALLSLRAVRKNGDLCWLAMVKDISERKRAEQEKEELIDRLSLALDEVKTLRGFIPICANCKNIRNDKGYWQRLELYIEEHSEAQFSHSLCPDCIKRLYPDLYEEGT